MEYFGIFEGPFGPFVLISFRSYGGILTMTPGNLEESLLFLLTQNNSCGLLWHYSLFLLRLWCLFSHMRPGTTVCPDGASSRRVT